LGDPQGWEKPGGIYEKEEEDENGLHHQMGP
jgi:hypothetical protein